MSALLFLLVPSWWTASSVAAIFCKRSVASSDLVTPVALSLLQHLVTVITLGYGTSGVLWREGPGRWRGPGMAHALGVLVNLKKSLKDGVRSVRTQLVTLLKCWPQSIYFPILLRLDLAARTPSIQFAHKLLLLALLC